MTNFKCQNNPQIFVENPWKKSKRWVITDSTGWLGSNCQFSTTNNRNNQWCYKSNSAYFDKLSQIL